MHDQPILSSAALLRAPAVPASEALTRGLNLTAAIGAGVAAGVFFAFSTFVMKALESLPPLQGLRAMQAINVAAPSALFMLLLFGTGLVAAALAVVSFRGPSSPAATLRIAAAAIYLIAVIGMTVAYHVPHNDALAAVDPSAPGAARAWADYAGPWTLLNHVRTLGGIASATLFTWAARLD